ncbi:hypothetical protein M427DRAFT_486525 [Gonapodya prolifera JEL478]|uniref:Uncharacterized protein n=1 Tax=Gonapodya prolifera (strain JEL478) TaxID=1344416 RepID=A0A139B1B1_GONPJ|nr:hypothetical protein M427DRAFT_486525 [Gonapodya prolifera JEL478]|eukprot:KXS22515.1 hypothetical protein M427DRAFT_486525 [Gonapodya prolifera JEL478]
MSPVTPGNATAAGAPPRSRMLMCSLCGREFGTASLAIHQKQCQEKQTNTTVWPHRSAAEYNAQAREQFLQQGRVQCPNCSRGFSNSDRLAVHLRSCIKDGNGNASGSGSGRAVSRGDSDQREGTSRPPMKTAGVSKSRADTPCPHCDKLFTANTLVAHLQHCGPSETRSGGEGGSQMLSAIESTRSPQGFGNGSTTSLETRMAELGLDVYGNSLDGKPGKPTAQVVPGAAHAEAQASQGPTAGGGGGTSRGRSGPMRFCTTCGCEFEEADKFCGECGKKRA